MIKLDTPYLTPDDYVLKIVWDEYPDNPRTWDNLGTFVTFERRRVSPDDNPFDSVEELIKEVCKSDKYIWQYVGRYEHSNVKYFLTNSGQLSGWDTCTCGIIFVSKEDVRENYNVKKITPKLKERIYEIFEAELETYTNYVNGEVFGCKLYNLDGEEMDSCYGFYNEEEGVEYFDYKVTDLVEAEEFTEVKTYFKRKE
jgi:hypothetical protein